MPPPKLNNVQAAEDNADDDYDDIPLEHQRPFGSGLHRRPIAFVSASGPGTLQSVDANRPTPKPQPNVADIYLSMVLSEDSRSQSAPPSTTAPPPPKPSTPAPNSDSPQGIEETCPVCRLPLTTPSDSSDKNTDPSKPTPHTQSLAHQLCLPHSHPPSALDRTRMGLSYLAAHGWDPDARSGLGAAQQGIAYPVKAKVKDDVLGVGMVVSKREKEGAKKNGGRLLDAGKVRKMVGEERRRGERIREELFGDGRVERYLGRAADSI
ncbi:hypothetical protein B0J18DRAFT_472492 [Chaetomium sp. MPI-SDFR-AT-0129]|nr:hypothetical protein B0J18DRAFT_472492 [Chaetomium sp. MPI-SDFR-AT-0129]